MPQRRVSVVSPGTRASACVTFAVMSIVPSTSYGRTAYLVLSIRLTHQSS